MSDTATAPVQVSAEPAKTEVTTVTATPFAKDAWSETPPEPKKEGATTPAVTTTPVATTTTNTEEEIIEPKEWLKREFDIDDPAILKAEREELKALKAKLPEEIKWNDEQSKQIHELLREGKPENKKAVREFLQTQEQIDELIGITEVNKDNAADIIKLQMKLKNKQLSPSEIDFEYKQNYVAPKEPVQKATEDEDDFKERHDEWKEQAAIVEQRRIIAAKLAQPELLKAKTEIVLPELTKPTAQVANEPDPVKLKEVRDYFLSKLESDYSKTEGFTTQVKDESVEIPISFKIPDEQKVALKGRLQDGLDVNEFIDARWFSEKGEPKIEQIMSDIYQLENLDKILSGVANESANQRLLAFRKQATNADLKVIGNQNTFQPNADGRANISPFAKEAWSEKPPVLT